MYTLGFTNEAHALQVWDTFTLALLGGGFAGTDQDVVLLDQLLHHLGLQLHLAVRGGHSGGHLLPDGVRQLRSKFPSDQPGDGIAKKL